MNNQRWIEAFPAIMFPNISNTGLLSAGWKECPKCLVPMWRSGSAGEFGVDF